MRSLFFFGFPIPMHEHEPADDARLDANADAEPGADRPLNRRERGVVLARIQALMEFWGITIDDLLQDTPAPEPVLIPDLPPKYRHPTTGETWDGQGAQPDWLRRALLKEGMRVEELRQAALASPPPAPLVEPAADDASPAADDTPPAGH